MQKVFLAIPRAFDDYLGYVKDDGEIYLSKLGFDERLGNADLASGKIYAARLGPDKKLGYVDLKTGKVYLSRLGIDEYVGRVEKDGRMYRHVPLGADDYVGKIDPFVSFAHSGGAMLLLVLPALDSNSPDAEAVSQGEPENL